MNRQDACLRAPHRQAKVAKCMISLSLKRKARNGIHGVFRLFVSLPNWPPLALAFRVPNAGVGCSWRLIISD